MPFKQSTYGLAETYVGDWFAKQSKKQRQQLIIASKVCGRSQDIDWCRLPLSATTKITKQQLHFAVDQTLKRLQTDYLDILILHWPERYTLLQGGNHYEPHREYPDSTTIYEQVTMLHELIQLGKIRSYGLSNENPYGVGVFTGIADGAGLTRPILIQQPYNLYDRYEWEQKGLMEACSPNNGDIALMAVSPLAGGTLTEKYNVDTRFLPTTYRLGKYPGFMHRYLSIKAREAYQKYRIMSKNALQPIERFALAYVYSCPFIASTTIGVTTKEQLFENIRTLNLVPLGPHISKLIEEIYSEYSQVTQGAFKFVDPNYDYEDPTGKPWGTLEEDVDPQLDALLEKIGL
jgi:aryl-alcohol dehydrogenase-like predicted oxidoreductase